MKIVNNKIHIIKGETPTYDVVVFDPDTGAPFRLLDGLNNPVIEFSVKESVYDLTNKYVFKVYMDYKNETRFSTDEIFSYNDLDGSEEPQWDNSIVPPENHWAVVDEDGYITGACLYELEHDDYVEFRYYNPQATWEEDEEHPDGVNENNYKWCTYEFSITFPFPYSDGFNEYNKIGYGGMSDLEPKTYKYEVTLFDGVLVLVDGEYMLTDINYKKPLLEVNDFIVGGTTSE